MPREVPAPRAKVLVIAVGKDPEVREISNTLEAMQAIVGGYIERVGLEPNIGMYVNEEGRLKGLPPNRVIIGPRFSGLIVGDLFIAREKYGELADLTADDIAKYKLAFWSQSR